MQKVSSVKYIASGNLAHVFQGIYVDEPGAEIDVACKLCISDEEHPEEIYMENFNNVMINCARDKSKMVQQMTVEYYPRIFQQNASVTDFPVEVVEELRKIIVDEEEDLSNDLAASILSKYKQSNSGKMTIYDQCSAGSVLFVHFSSLLPKCVSFVQFLDDLVNNKKTFYGNTNATPDMSLMQVITQVSVFLHEMQLLDPEFSHNDLVPNIFIEPLSSAYDFIYRTDGINISFKTLYRVRIIDFGSSRFSVDLRDNKKIKIPEERYKLFAQPFFFVNGAGTLPNTAYDIHRVLNFVYLHIQKMQNAFPLSHRLVTQCVTGDMLGIGMLDNSESASPENARVFRSSVGDLYNGRLSLFPRFFYDPIMEHSRNFSKEKMAQFMHYFMAQQYDNCADILPVGETKCRSLLTIIKRLYERQEYQQLSGFCSFTTKSSYCSSTEKEVYYIGNKIESMINILKRISLLIK